MSNWPGNVDYGHSNHTLKTPRESRTQGEFEDDRITPSRFVKGLLVLLAFFIVFHIGADVGF